MQEELGRIADALERIAIALESGKVATGTPFPWDSIPHKIWKYIRREVEDGGDYRPFYGRYKWPLSCEELAFIGRSGLRQCRFTGDVRIKHIEEKLSELGFKLGV